MRKHVLLLAVILSLCAVSCSALSFLPCSPTVPTPNGNARIVDGIVRLTDNGVSQAGSVFTSKAVNITRFDTTFSFRLGGPAEHADGITFCIQNDPKGPLALGSLGGYLGYGYSEPWDTAGILRSVAVEFDDYYNDEFGDLTADHVGIDMRGSIVSKTQADAPVPLFGDTVNARVIYEAGMLSVYAWGNGRQPSVPFLRYAVDIPSVLGSNTGYVGFTAATAKSTQYSDVISWVFCGSRLLPAQGKSPTVAPD
jgi:hypothetical protein